MRCTLAVKNVRRILCVFPAYTPSFGTFSGAYSLMKVRAFMPPQGLLVIAAYLPEKWEMRFIDENLRAATDADFVWADAVFVSGMHVQEPQIRSIHERSKRHARVTALGGSSVSAAPEKYPYFDYLHIGELGDATDKLVATLDADITPPLSQVVLETKDRTPLGDFPLPAYKEIPLKKYLLGSVQFSSGCPYRCEFCDIPALYGRQPRLKSADQLLAELEAFISQPAHPTVVYFVDDNFIGNRKAAKEMLPHLISWQRKHHYPLQFACEATLNLAKQHDILGLMREAGFFTVFVGIETPELDALKHIAKDHNNAVPMMEAIRTLNSYGLEITSGIILGLDTETRESEVRLRDFIDSSAVPVLTINLLQALPKTPLWDRLAKEGRLVNDPTLESNVRFLRPHDEVVASWHRCIAHAYAPENIFARFSYQMDHTYGNRLKTPARGKLTRANLRRAWLMTKNIFWEVGVKADYRRPFWRATWHALMKGQIEAIFNMGFVCHHMIRYTRDALRGEYNASFYTTKVPSKARREPVTVAIGNLKRSG